MLEGILTRSNGFSFCYRLCDYSSEDLSEDCGHNRTLEWHRGPTHLASIPYLCTGREQAISQPPTRQYRWITIEAFSGSPVHHLRPHDRAVVCAHFEIPSTLIVECHRLIGRS